MPNGMAFRFTTARGVTFAMAAVATNTPAMGDTVLPIEAANDIGNIMVTPSAPKSVAILGTSGPKAKKAALPLPIRMEAKNIIIVITMPMPTAPKPRL